MNNKLKTFLSIFFVLALGFLLIACNPTVHTVTFNSDGGTSVEAIKVEDGKLATKPTDPTKEGYEFVHWQLDGEEFLFTTPIKADITLKALWDEDEAPATFTVTFDSDGGSNVASQTVEDGKLATKPANPTKAGHTFVEWQLNGVAFNFATAITANTTLKAKWQADTPAFDTVTVTITATLPENTPAGDIYISGDLKNDAATATWSGADLKATRTGQTATVVLEYDVEDLPLSIAYKWTRGSWEAAEKGAEGEELDNREVTITTANETLIINDTVGSWADSGTDPEPETFTVTFDAKGGSSVLSQTVEEGKLATKPANPTKDGYTFIEWQLDDEEFLFTTPITADITLTAIWEAIPEYTVSFDVNGGTNVPNQTIIEGDKALKPSDPTRSGYNFVEWQLNSVTFNFETPITADITLTAIWEAIPEYTVSFATNGGSSIASITDFEGEEVEKPTDPTREEYVFIGWFLDSDLTIAVEWPLTLNVNLTIYAAWNLEVDLMALLNDLIANYTFDATSLIPEDLRPGANLYSGNLETDFSDFVNTSDLVYSGFGEQWQMVLDNLVQAESVLTVLNTAEGTITAGVTAFNNFLDANPANANYFATSIGQYTVIIQYLNGELTYLLDFETTGGFATQILLTSVVGENQKVVRVQIGDNNAVKYQITDEGFIIASKYGGTIYGYEGIRTSYIELYNDEDDNVNGNIFEELTVERPVDDEGNQPDPIQTTSAAQFVIGEEYLFVVGNKASGLIGFDSTILEIYDVESGKFLGYEIEEKLSVLTYNTLWFNLDSQVGITSIKELNGAVYVNGEATVFKTKKWGGIHGKTASRRYDIEFRKQYVYMEVDGKIESVEYLVPMFFVQAEQFNTVSADVRGENSYLSTFTLNVSSFKADLEASYAANVSIFKENKDSHSYEDTIDYIGNRITFE